MDDAEYRAIAKLGRDHDVQSWDEACYLAKHTMIGASYILHERLVDLGHALRDSLPRPLRNALTPK